MVKLRASFERITVLGLVIVEVDVEQKKELTKKIDGELLFLDVISLTRKFRFSMKNEELTITLDIVGLDKHFIYYLIDMVDILKKAIK